MRIGMIGCGTVAGYGHIPALIASDDFELVALADVREERLRELGAQHKIADLYTDYHELLARPDIDAVGVATSVGGHHPVVMAALAAGKHVFCEKPIADAVDLGWQMVRKAAETQRILAVNFEMRAAQGVIRFRDIIQAGEIGPVRFLRLTYDWSGPRWAGMERHRMMMTEGKGPIFDCGVHFFDLVRWFTGAEYQEVQAAGLYVEKYPYPDHVVATCHMNNGALAIIDESWVYAHTVPKEGKPKFIHRIEAEGEDGAITEEHGEIVVQNSHGVRVEKIGAEGKAFGVMYHMFAESIKAGRLLDLAGGEDGVRAIEAAEAALASVAFARNRLSPR